jgi:pyruvate,orthophosphate dikinase
MNSKQFIYLFGGGSAEGDARMKETLGGKGANLAEMSNLGFPVPPGFTIATSECKEFYKNNKELTSELLEKLDPSLKHIENILGGGIGFGNEEFPLLLSVRSGAPVSMPGMMDTILNLGLNDKTVAALSKKTGNPRFAYDSYRRFIQMYSNVVLGVPHHSFESILDDVKLEARIKTDADLTFENLSYIIKQYKDIILKKVGKEFPQNPHEQLRGAIKAVFLSWKNERAEYYRNMYNYSADMGTAVTVQAMVFGNLGETSATGVAFTRNPSDGTKAIYGEYLINAQGEDVVAGIRTPYPIDKASKTPDNASFPSLEEAMPQVYTEFLQISAKLEQHYKDMQDIEFTIQEGKLWILQTRSGKRTIKSAIKIAVDLVESGIITREQALRRIDPNEIDKLLHHALDPSAMKTLIDKGLPASPGAASGVIALSPESVLRFAKEGKKSILTRVETSPEDIEGMNISAGILTTRGGMTSHAAVVARGMGKVCITSARGMNINYDKNEVSLANGKILKEGEIITIDGSTGEVYLGEVKTVEPELSKEFLELMKWADEIRKLSVRANAETTKDAKMAVKFGAEGIGLCRTEHMFFNKDRIIFVRQMILAETKEARKAALEKLLPFQVQDFTEIFNVMEGLPVNIRLLDPPLHEFVPQNTAEIEELAHSLKMEVKTLQTRIASLHESNPMLGHRGVRLAITYPEIYEMQVRAIFTAGYTIWNQNGKAPKIEIMIPLIVTSKEMEILYSEITKIADEFAVEKGKKIEYSVGTMIETPRAALIGIEIAKTASYFSFGTNDLTQTTLAISRDDSASFIPDYIKAGIFEKDPFVQLDITGVGRLIEIAIKEGRSVNPNLKVSICGEHGGNPFSIKFCAKVNMNYVSCSPYRIPVARLAAAIAQIELSEKK